jgi:trehalose 6-phosphate phosphatase
MKSEPTHWRTQTDGALSKAVQSLNFGLISDFDGTLSPIVDQAEAAQLSPRIEVLLKELVTQVSMLAIISGREINDLRKRIHIPEVKLIGNHGMEKWVDGRRVLADGVEEDQNAIASVAGHLEDRFAEGVWFENKGLSLSLHYRSVKDPQKFKQEQLLEMQKLADRNGLRFSEGRMILEFKVNVDVNKGDALNDLAQQDDLNAVIYIGDDITDMAAFEACKVLRKKGIKAYGIGVKSEESDPQVVASADYFLEGLSDVDDLLSWIISERKASST